MIFFKISMLLAQLIVIYGFNDFDQNDETHVDLHLDNNGYTHEKQQQQQSKPPMVTLPPTTQTDEPGKVEITFRNRPGSNGAPIRVDFQASEQKQTNENNNNMARRSDDDSSSSNDEAESEQTKREYDDQVPYDNTK